MESALSLRPELRQKILLSQRQRQGLEILQLPLLALEQRLNTELINNPVLEEKVTTATSEAPVPEATAESNDEALYDAEAVERAEEWQEELPWPSENYTSGATADDRLLFTAAPEPDFRDQLAGELNSRELSPRQLELSKSVIDALDDRGFLPVPAADLAMVNNAELPEIEAAIAQVQALDPPGIGARNLPECWLLQLRRRHQSEPRLEQILTEGVAELQANQLPKLAHRLNLSLAELSAELAKLKQLSPYPELETMHTVSAVIHPDAEIVEEHGHFRAHVFTEPRQLHLSPHYQTMLQNPSLDAETRNYLEEKFKSAVELLKSLTLRQSTLQRLTELLIQVQEDFLRHGVSSLKPYTMKEAAQLLELSESTISRTVADKYVATPQGLFPYRYFFSAGMLNQDGAALSNHAVMAKLQELVDSEDARHPLSDEKLAKLLRDAGFDIARRTVAKYRDLLKIPGSSQRKKYI